MIIWDVRTGAKKRAFQCGDYSRWPVFKYVLFFLDIFVLQLLTKGFLYDQALNSLPPL